MRGLTRLITAILLLCALIAPPVYAANTELRSVAGERSDTSAKTPPDLDVKVRTYPPAPTYPLNIIATHFPGWLADWFPVLLGLVAILGAPVAFITGAFFTRVHFQKSEKWKRTEFAAAEIKKLASDPVLHFCCKCLDRNNVDLEVPKEFSYLFASREESATSKPSTDQPKVIRHTWKKLFLAIDGAHVTFSSKDVSKKEALLYSMAFESFFVYANGVRRFEEQGVIKQEDLGSMEYYLGRVIQNKAFKRLLLQFYRGRVLPWAREADTTGMAKQRFKRPKQSGSEKRFIRRGDEIRTVHVRKGDVINFPVQFDRNTTFYHFLSEAHWKLNYRGEYCDLIRYGTHWCLSNDKGERIATDDRTAVLSGLGIKDGATLWFSTPTVTLEEVQVDNRLAAEELAANIFPADLPDVQGCYTRALSPRAEWSKEFDESVDRLRYYVGHHREKPIGITGLYVLKDQPDAAWLGWFGIKSEHRTKGLGSALLQATVQQAAKEGFKVLHLWTTSSDLTANAQKLFSKEGFSLQTTEFKYDGDYSVAIYSWELKSGADIPYRGSMKKAFVGSLAHITPPPCD